MDPSSSPQEMTDILDIEGVIGFPWGTLLWILALVGLLLVAFFLIRFFIKRRQNKIAKSLTPTARVQFELDQLDRQQFLERGDFRKFYFFLSEIFRRYVQDSYGYPAIDKTTGEITRELLPVIDLDSSEKEQAQTFLERSDQVKFANQIPSEGAPLLDKEFVKNISLKTRIPKP